MCSIRNVPFDAVCGGCRPSDYSRQMQQLGVDFMKSVTAMGSMMEPPMSYQQLVRMEFADVLKIVEECAQLTAADQQQQSILVAGFATSFVMAHQQQLVSNAFASAGAASTPVTPHSATTPPATLLQQQGSVAAAQMGRQQHAAAALLSLAKINWFVQLRLCGWHWIKAWKEYAHRGQHFKDRPMQGKLPAIWKAPVLCQ